MSTTTMKTFLAAGLAQIRGVRVEPQKVVTNIVIFDVKGAGKTAGDICAALKKRQVLANATGPALIRMVTHCDVDRAGIDIALVTLREIL